MEMPIVYIERLFFCLRKKIRRMRIVGDAYC